MKNNPIESCLGLCARARKLVTGVNDVHRAVAEGVALMVFADPAASAGSLKKLTDGCRFYGVPMYKFCESGLPGRAIGDTTRVAVAITDDGFIRMAEKALSQLPEGVVELLVSGVDTEVNNG